MVQGLKLFPDICLISGIFSIFSTITAAFITCCGLRVSAIRTELADKEPGEKGTGAQEI
jgi:hypothetical protein